MSSLPVTRVGIALAVRDVPSVLAFYRDVLEFEVEAEYDDPAYAILTREGFRLSLAEEGHEASDLPGYEMTVGASPQKPAVRLILEVGDCDAVLAAVLQRGAQPVSEVFRPPWGGARCFIADPEGNLVELEQLS